MDEHHEHINTEGHAAHHLHDADGENQAWFSNRKRTYDSYQQVDLDHMRNLNTIAAQAFQNAVETANMVGKQAVRHADHDPDQPVFRDLIRTIALEVVAAQKDK